MQNAQATQYHDEMQDEGTGLMEAAGALRHAEGCAPADPGPTARHA